LGRERILNYTHKGSCVQTHTQTLSLSKREIRRLFTGGSVLLGYELKLHCSDHEREDIHQTKRRKEENKRGIFFSLGAHAELSSRWLFFLLRWRKRERDERERGSGLIQLCGKPRG
jgi:hypothetical protein